MKTIELTKEELQELLDRKAGAIIIGNHEVRVKKKPEKWEPKNGEWVVNSFGDVFYYDKIDEVRVGYGSTRHTKEQAERAAEQMRIFNRLLAYRDEFDPDFKRSYGQSGYYVLYNERKNVYRYGRDQEVYDVGKVYMSEEVAEELCRKLNSGEVVL